MAGKKISRKQLLNEPDEFITTTGRIIRFLQDNRRQVTLYGIIVLAVLAAGFSGILLSPLGGRKGSGDSAAGASDLSGGLERGRETRKKRRKPLKRPWKNSRRPTGFTGAEPSVRFRRFISGTAITVLRNTMRPSRPIRKAWRDRSGPWPPRAWGTVTKPRGISPRRWKISRKTPKARRACIRKRGCSASPVVTKR